MDFSSYKAFLFDVDKTLTNSKKEITSQTRDALQSLVEKKYQIGMCTGRHFATLQKYHLPYFPKSSTHIVSGGAQIITSTGETLWENLISYEVGMEVIEKLSTLGIWVLICHGDNIYGNDLSLERWKVDRDNKALAMEIHPLTEYPHVGISLINARETSQDVIEMLERIQDISYKPMINYDGKPYVDITARGVNKSSAITQWCRMLAIQESEVIGFGDSDNDIEFLETVGYSVAMGNAAKNVQAIADAVTTDCDHDGVAEWIRRNV